MLIDSEFDPINPSPFLPQSSTVQHFSLSFSVPSRPVVSVRFTLTISLVDFGSIYFLHHVSQLPALSLSPKRRRRCRCWRVASGKNKSLAQSLVKQFFWVWGGINFFSPPDFISSYLFTILPSFRMMTRMAIRRLPLPNRQSLCRQQTKSPSRRPPAAKSSPRRHCLQVL